MHPSITQALASEHMEDARRAANQQRRAAELAAEDRRAGRRGFSRYFSHAREGHIKSLRRARRGSSRSWSSPCVKPAGESPVVVLLSGDSGVGKTRLVGSSSAAPPTDGALVLRGEAVEQADGELPYAPLIGALRPLVASAIRRSTRLDAGSRAQLAALLPGLDEEAGASRRERPIRAGAAVRGAARAARRAQRGAAGGPDARGHALGRSLDAHVRRLPRAQPALGAGGAAAQLPDRRAPSPSPAAAAALRARPARPRAPDRARAVRPRGARRGARGHPRRGARARSSCERLFERSEGNPLYTEELLAAGLDGRGAAPQSLRDAFMLRIERLSPDAQRRRA